MSSRSPFLRRERLAGTHDAEFPAEDAAADEVAADEARRRLRDQRFAPIAPDERICAQLIPGECIVALRRGVAFERRVGRSRERGDGPVGDLYVTTRRILILGRVRAEYELAAIEELDIGPGVLRLMVDGSRCLEVRVPDPRVLRVEIAAARLAGGSTLA